MRVAIVNDLKLAVVVLSRVIQSKPQCELAWVAKDGQQAIDLAKKDLPDLILMDLIMPIKNGQVATETIMKESPCPIVIVSACVESCMGMVFATMGAGALDVASTPYINEEGVLVGAEELSKKIDTIAFLTKKQTQPQEKPQANFPSPQLSDTPLLLFGASTGGPKTLLEILKNLSPPLPFAIVVVQHVDQEFLAGFSRWLEEHTHLTTKLAETGMRPEKGIVYVAQTNKHLVLTHESTFAYIDNPLTVYSPSVDLFFESVAQNGEANGVACLLTGMGSDGAQGLLSLKKKGWTTYAQEERSCVVYGMPKKAKELEAATKIASTQELISELHHFQSSFKEQT